MGLFSGVINTYKKSEAAVIVQNLLQIQADAGMLNLDPASFATTLVDEVWTEKPAIFRGKFGQRPFKISVAAAAFANGVSKYENDPLIRNSLIISLGKILSEIEVNGRLYPLNGLDEQLLETAMAIYIEKSEELANSPLGKEIDDLLSNS